MTRNKWNNASYIASPASVKLTKFQGEYAAEAIAIERSEIVSVEEKKALLKEAADCSNKTKLQSLVGKLFTRLHTEQQLTEEIIQKSQDLLVSPREINNEIELTNFITELYLLEVEIRLNLSVCHQQIKALMQGMEALLPLIDQNDASDEAKEMWKYLTLVEKTKLHILVVINNYESAITPLKKYISERKQNVVKETLAQPIARSISKKEVDIETNVDAYRKKSKSLRLTKRSINQSPSNQFDTNIGNTEETQATLLVGASIYEGGLRYYEKELEHQGKKLARSEKLLKQTKTEIVKLKKELDESTAAQTELKLIKEQREKLLNTAQSAFKSALEIINVKVDTLVKQASIDQDYQPAKEEAQKLSRTLSTTYNEYFIKKSITPEVFKLRCQDAVENARRVLLPKQRDWSEVLSDVRFIATSVANIASKLFTGNFNFFTAEQIDWKKELDTLDSSLRQLVLPNV